jgi:hypothetical protein
VALLLTQLRDPLRPLRHQRAGHGNGHRYATAPPEGPGWAGSSRPGARSSASPSGSALPGAEGFGRLDALGRGGNFVFATLLNDRRNFARADGPVSFPALWDASWFDWVQYNGAIRQPMGRNVAEAMGVRAGTSSSRAARRSSSTAPPCGQNIHEMETLLAGPSPGAGLRPPPWPEDLLGPIDRTAAARGQALFAQPLRRLPRAAGRRRLSHPARPRGGAARHHGPLERIGTDPDGRDEFRPRRAYLEPGRARRSPPRPGCSASPPRSIRTWYEQNGRGRNRPSRQRRDGRKPPE